MALVPGAADLQTLAALLTERRAQVAVAESCTGGELSALLTSLSGSSAWFDRGVVTYSNAAKIDLLGVSPEILRTCGAVSAETAEAMALGVLRSSRQASFSVAITGIAGPQGGRPEKPVGTVFIATASAEGAKADRHLFAGERAAVRRQAVAAALSALIIRVKST